MDDEQPGWRAIEALYRDHAEWLRALVTRRLRAQPTEVDDIVQDTWLRAAGCKTDNIQHPKAFLSQTALNLFRDRKRREAVRQQHREGVAADRGGGDRHSMSEQEAILELERIVLDLPEKIRDVFVLSRFRHMSNAEIATTLGISIKTVEWRMGKALALCMSRLRD
uniref:RNA polymerase sigma factor n=1 Tax=Sphingomonas populi TaxID=2484750 RepID=UPI001E4DDAF4|nr:sigma-70 family RNA polymerase sigma factor [Sphingomonas populi]